MTLLLTRGECEQLLVSHPIGSFVSLKLEPDLENAVEKCLEKGYPFNCAIGKNGNYPTVVEAMLNGGVLIRPYRKDLDYYIEEA